MVDASERLAPARPARAHLGGGRIARAGLARALSAASVSAVLVLAACAGAAPEDDGTGTSTPTDGTAATPTDAGTPAPTVIPLPDGFQPEGVAAGAEGTIVVGSLRDGDVWQGDLTGEGSVLVDAPEGRIAVGLKVDDEHGRLFVAGGPTGQGFVYDAETGEDLGALALAAAGAGTFVNDVALTPQGAWFTDSQQPVLYHVPFADDGSLGSVETLTLTGPAADTSASFNLNGITASPDGSTLVVVHSGRAELMTVEPGTGESALIDLGLDSVPNGDGILLDGSTLWVVQNFLNQVAEIELAEDLSSGRVVTVHTDEDFRVPTTIASVDGTLVVVNARFDIQEPSPQDEYELVVLAR